MSAARVYVAVEGPHDVELVAVLLGPDGFKRVQHRRDVDGYWDPLIPKTFPHRDDLLARVPVPTFLRSDQRWIAIHAAGGETNLVSKVEETLAVLSSPPSAVGVVLDADSRKSAQERFTSVAEKLEKLGLVKPARPGEVCETSPRCGVYVLPDNASQGTLEDLLLECGAAVYPELLGAARGYIGGIDCAWPELAKDDTGAFEKGAGRNKATIASMASVLKPGKAIQNSTQDNRWLKDPRALALPRVAALRGFLTKLLELPES